MSLGTDAMVDVPAKPVSRRPKGPGTCSLLRPDSDTLVLGPSRARGWPTRANMSTGGWLVVWAFLGGMILTGGLLWMLIVVVVLTLPVYWGNDAVARGAWGELVAASVLEVAVVTLLVLGVLAVASGGRWVTFDRKRLLLTVKRRPFGWRREPRVVESRPLDDVAAVQLIFGGVAAELLSQSPYDDRSPPITREHDWYEFNLSFRGSPESRMTLASGPDWVWMRQAGRELAEFLGVPLVDRLHHAASSPSAEPGAAADGGA